MGTAKEIYQKIVCERNLEQLKLILGKEIPAVGFEFISFELLKDTRDGFPYIYCLIDSNMMYAAQMIGLLVDIKEIIPDYGKDYYYLPIVAFCETLPEEVRQYVNKGISINHELLHVKDMLDLIDEDPGFPEKVWNYGKYSPIKNDDLPESIDHEIFKVFRMEPQAIRQDYEAGENYILLPLKNGEIYKYVCSEFQQCLLVKMVSEITRINKIYLDKFNIEPSAKQIISDEFKRSIKKFHYRTLFSI